MHNTFWYSKVKTYSFFVIEDIFIRDFITKKLLDNFISLIEIRRKTSFLEINIHVAKPSLVMGNNGSRLFDLRKELSEKLSLKFSSREITINVIEVVSPDLNSRLLAESIRQQLEKRIPFRRVMKTAILKAQKAGAKGIKVQISGRLNGAEIARTEWVREGQVPLHTLKANIDYFNHKALLT